MGNAYDRFNDAWAQRCLELRAAFARQVPADDAPDFMEAATLEVVDDWLSQGDYAGLVSWFISNYDTGGGDHVLDRLGPALKGAGQTRELVRLFRGAVANRRLGYWNLKRAISGQRAKLSEQGYQASLQEMRERELALRTAMAQCKRILADVGRQEDVRQIEEEERLLAAGRRLRPAGPADKRPMTDELFWDLIRQAGARAETSAEACENLTLALVAFGSTAIRSFQKRLLAHLDALCTWDLWAYAFIVRGGCGDDAFDAFRAWLVLQGGDLYRRAREDFKALESMPAPVEDPQCEQLLFVADEAYELRFQKPMPPVKRKAHAPSGVAWREEDLPKRYPELCRKYGSEAQSAGPPLPGKNPR